MKLPIKDRETIPWMSKREIPAIRIALSAWRELRKNKDAVKSISDSVAVLSRENVEKIFETDWRDISVALERVAVLDKRAKKDHGW